MDSNGPRHRRQLVALVYMYLHITGGAFRHSEVGQRFIKISVHEGFEVLHPIYSSHAESNQVDQGQFDKGKSGTSMVDIQAESSQAASNPANKSHVESIQINSSQTGSSHAGQTNGTQASLQAILEIPDDLVRLQAKLMDRIQQFADHPSFSPRGSAWNLFFLVYALESEQREEVGEFLMTGAEDLRTSPNAEEPAPQLLAVKLLNSGMQTWMAQRHQYSQCGFNFANIRPEMLEEDPIKTFERLVKVCFVGKGCKLAEKLIKYERNNKRLTRSLFSKSMDLRFDSSLGDIDDMADRDDITNGTNLSSTQLEINSKIPILSSRSLGNTSEDATASLQSLLERSLKVSDHFGARRSVFLFIMLGMFGAFVLGMVWRARRLRAREKRRLRV